MITPLIETRRSGILLAAPALAAVAALFATGALLAQQQPAAGTATATEEPDGQTTEELDQYRVELIVFEYGDALAGTTEDWSAPAAEEPSEETAADDETAGQAGGTETEAGAGALPGERQEPRASEDATSTEPPEDRAGRTGAVGDQPEEPVFRFMPLPEEELQLGDLYRKLGNTEGYQPLLHVAWQQPGYEPEAARALDLSRLAELPDRLRGEVRLYRSRFLHLELDLELWSTRGPPLPGTTAAEPLLPNGSRSDQARPDQRRPDQRRQGRRDTGEPLSALQPDVYRLSQRRKLRSGELHYYDHPRYAVLARVTPVEPAAEPATEPAVDPGSGPGEATVPDRAEAASATR